MPDIIDIVAERLSGHDYVAWAVETARDGSQLLRIIPGSPDVVWGKLNRLRLPWFPSAPENDKGEELEETEEESVRRWLSLHVLTEDGATISPFETAWIGDPEDTDPLYPIAAAMGLIGGFGEEGPDEPVA